MTPSNRGNATEYSNKLRKAINHIGSVRTNLVKNSQEIKQQIHSNINRHINALRNREAWLMNQVEILRSAKEEVLHNQQSLLASGLSSLEPLLLEPDSSDLYSDKSDCICDEDMKPKESPHLSFQTDSVGLREIIMKYGNVSTGGFLDYATFSGKYEAASLPKHLGEHEGPDHHVLTKCLSSGQQSSTYQPLRRTKSYSNHTAHTTHGWLMDALPIPRDIPSKPSISCTNLSDWLVTSSLPPEKLHHVHSDASVFNWLHQLKTSPQMEEEDFELMDTVMSKYSTDGDSVIYDLRPPTTTDNDNQSDLFIPPNLIGSVTSDQPTASYLKEKELCPPPQDELSIWLKNSQALQSNSRGCQPFANLRFNSIGSCAIVRYFTFVITQDNSLWLKIESRTESAEGSDHYSRTNSCEMTDHALIEDQLCSLLSEWILVVGNAPPPPTFDIHQHHTECDWLRHPPSDSDTFSAFINVQSETDLCPERDETADKFQSASINSDSSQQDHDVPQLDSVSDHMNFRHSDWLNTFYNVQASEVNMWLLRS